MVRTELERDLPDLIAAMRAGAGNNETAIEWVSWRGATQVVEVWTRARFATAVGRAAGAISVQTRPGDRVVVAPPPGLAFAAMFLGCLGSGRIAVPAQAPTTSRARAFLDGIVAATDARLVLTTHTALDGDAPHIALRTPAPDEDAYIQFTSGSTQTPRGAVITHGALAHNLAAIGDAWRLGPRDHGVFWLPPFHDMGLVGALLAPIAFGFPATLMHPAAFLQRPARWLELIAARRGTFSGAPNFAYDLCIDRIDQPSRDALDLSSWRVAVNGAEPVSAATLRRFAAAFAPQGLRADALSPGYGLAESVLFVTARRAEDDCAAAVNNVVTCGAPDAATTVRVVDEATGLAAPDGVTGDIWVAGPSLARGYWNAPEETAATFNGQLPEDTRRYLRTGDLGFIRDGALHVCGRVKDVIVRAGRKIHATDIEHAIAALTGVGAPRRTAVFACTGVEERLVVVHETGPGIDEGVTRIAIADALGAAFDLIADDIVLTPRGGVRVTSSGKIARAATRDAYLAGALAPAHQPAP